MRVKQELKNIYKKNGNLIEILTGFLDKLAFKLGL